jgi:hypothetical protein
MHSTTNWNPENARLKNHHDSFACNSCKNDNRTSLQPKTTAILFLYCVGAMATLPFPYGALCRVSYIQHIISLSHVAL